ncbi:AGAP005241-PA [Anopheles gambiae str. PEST]|uniref:AGAP005241-PA n=1 Tax=Anopheles gambiae TaxID=7165 RepID=Q7Q9G9_ANOGA|nr:AGAP005241-PA [Anopheles gambiae str. PEST]
MAKSNHNQLGCYVMIALFVAGKVQCLPDRVEPAGQLTTVPERVDGPTESTTDDVAATVTEDDLYLVDTTTTTQQSIKTTTHDRVLFTDTPVMDAITIVWYLATFIALISFFLVMACADHNRCRSRKPSSSELTPPPTPAPSYHHFAPPSYDSLVFEKDNDSIFIIPYDTRIDGAHHARSVDDLASNLEYIIETPTTTTVRQARSPSLRSVRVSDISEGSDAVSAGIAVSSTPAVQEHDATDRCYVTVL